VVEKVGIENTSDEETAGDSQSIVGIEEEDPLKSDEGSDEDLENKEDAVDEVVHLESDEESGEDLTEAKRRASRMEESPPGLLRGSSASSLKCRQ